MKEKNFFNPEKGIEELYIEKWIPEIVKVRDIDDLLVINHYWQDAEGELWNDFDHPNENFVRTFDAYRERKGFMQPSQICELRKQLHLSVREFAKRLGISYSTVSQIENNQRIQVLYQENLFEHAKKEFETTGELPDHADKNSQITARLNFSTSGTPFYISHNSYISEEHCQSKSNEFRVIETLGDGI
ncbi:helix-turn-helix domain-containing protein [Pediococcus ethanolidurans]|uniref:Helix-turn-helix n=1 Tax=Pediococcus ethanolidurans TaxID=319653 RepID=A0A0R2K1V6_9LACO|nr:helix-turn-helix domain-containing protein [Pediococcus ethanolidurans]KRN83539.1 hypothetical protein IV87_GL000007 [Pediococcus ethanolidurans]GEN94106.1 hypothetical protein PET01_01560 [Pediococcus ethanolidurans]SER05372.1 Helix-turn-helix [Pediococcus ethanolidurans]